MRQLTKLFSCHSNISQSDNNVFGNNQVCTVFTRVQQLLTSLSCFCIDTLVKRGTLFVVVEHGSDESSDAMGFSSLCSGKKSLCRSILFSAFLLVGSLCYIILGFWVLINSWSSKFF